MYTINMQQAQSETMTPVSSPDVDTPRSAGKRRLPVERKRVLLAERVLPSTKQYLDGMGYKTKGRALDVLVSAIQHPGIVRMIENNSQFSIINLTG